MSNRAIALVPVLFLLACGGASSATPPKDPTPPPADTATDRGAHMDSGTEADAAKKEDSAKDKGPGLGSYKAAEKSSGPGGAGGGVESAVVDTKEPLGGGTLSQDDIKKILEKNGEVFGECYSLGTGGKTKDLNGTVKVKATLGPNGTVNDVQVLKSDMKNAKVDACVANAFKKIKFPPPKNAGTSVITFPISFNGLEEVKR